MKGHLRIASILCVLAQCLAYAGTNTHAAELQRQDNTGAPANFVVITDRLHTSGQPTRAQLGDLKTKGYAFVINLATPASAGAIPEEGMLIARAGISYLNIPVDFKAPTQQDFDLFSNMLRQTGSRRVLVHCQVNKRASVFTFLHRVVHEGIAPDEAWRNVASIWEPDPQWIELIRVILKRQGIAFDPF